MKLKSGSSSVAHSMGLRAAFIRHPSERLEQGWHAVAVQREVEQQHIAGQDFVKDVAHVVVVDARASVVHARETSRAVLDVLVDDVDDAHVLLRYIAHATTVEHSSGRCAAS